MEEIIAAMIMSVGGGTLDVCAAKSAEGASGGIVILWDSGKWTEVDRVEGEFSISVLLACRRSGWKWACSCVYGPHDDGPREGLWGELSAVRAVWSLPWLVMGDFNVTHFPEDRNRQGPTDVGMANFSSWINDEGLIDIPPCNVAYTWINLRENPSLAHLDRVLLDAEWEARFPGCAGAHRLAFKLKRLRRRLREWARDARANRNVRKSLATEQIQRLDATERRGAKTIVAEELKMEEEAEWRQRSKALWLQSGDNNTRFFHAVASQQKHTNHIATMDIEGSTRMGDSNIASHLVDHYAKAFRRPRRWFLKWKDEFLPRVSGDQCTSLARPFQEEEV
ncbi:hypothetical protein QJS10_CPB13g01130 [Acorus calamus]|uniref:Endonuclease/exonuclease/phosphatase domain-containing protein n=1 Tax=Acorus calamus TaxID=4465 RepID=A0AAV9DFB3_ACOCL|nr:hypothetical protein QJS10_CPB13g01130 [Acorus calamus]